MRLAGLVLLTGLLVTIVLLWTRSGHQQVPMLPPTIPTRVAQVLSQTELASVEVAIQRARAPDPLVEVDPADYMSEVPTLTTPSTELDPDLRGIEVSGTLTVSPAWNDVKPQVILCRVGGTDRDIVRAQPVREQSGSSSVEDTSRWRALVQGAGLYWVGTIDPASTMEIEVAANLSDARVVIPDPIQMECFVVDARTQAPVTGAHLLYQPRVPSLGNRSEKVIPDAGIPGMYRWRCVPGDGTLSCRARNQTYEDQRIDCTASSLVRSLRMDLVTASCIRIRATVVGESASSKNGRADDALAGVILERNGVAVPWKGIARSFSPGCLVINVPDPDTYVVRISNPPGGYRASPPKTVLVREHECSEIAFELEPE